MNKRQDLFFSPKRAWIRILANQPLASQIGAIVAVFAGFLLGPQE